MLVSFLAFIATLSILIVIHEYGHYRVAIACGVKVLRFSVGFGPVVKSFKRGDTEFVLSALPLGGYVRMVDEREGPVAVADLPGAFNRKPLASRAAIVAAGPVANLLLAVLLYSLMYWIGVQDVKPVLASPVAGSLVERSGLQAGDWIREISLGAADASGPWTAIQGFDDLGWYVTRAALDHRALHLRVSGPNGQGDRVKTLDLSGLGNPVLNQDFMHKLGFEGVYSPAVMGSVEAGGEADRVGLKEGDLVVQVDGRAVTDGVDLIQRIRATQTSVGSPRTMQWVVERDGQTLNFAVTPRIVKDEQGQLVARIRAHIGALPPLVSVRYGLVDGFQRAVHRTYEICALNLQMMGRLLIGQASVKNLGGALSIADMAGQAARMGPDVFLGFLAAMSAMLGILNLLPVPVLDGGHLMYYLFEAVTGRSVSQAWLERLQRGGFALLLLMMTLALYNDIVRLTGLH